ncbi:acetyl-CoA C-acyltransferase [Aeromicrobium sp. S22]|uniref:acetyl-CoA C-acetyltransferase n=1 Tax=Aeromicrobium sp. S22 TaxID=2662029 RepID=UPI0013C01446|nr:acetyl-CoA C-acetyltransferase [Aeromicrobium sp. S22]MRK02446.1 acetyl-CoA C-acyltransferase [Aeromicrobium sp. S22]
MREAVICEPIRTPVGGYGGSLAPATAADLAGAVLAALVERTGLPSDAIDDVILGHCNPNSEAPAIGRVAALNAGLDLRTAGQQIDRRCGSGLQAVVNAAMAVQTGAADLVVAGGAESMSNVPFYSTDIRWGAARTGVTMHDALARARQTAGGHRYPVAGGMIETAENLRREHSISRADQDALAAQSHQRAVAAQKAGIFDEEIIPVTVCTGRRQRTVEVDEHPRADTTVETLAALRPIMGKVDPDATVTAGNASGQNDAAAACIVTTPERAAALGLRPLVALRSWAVAGVPVETMGIGPVPATAAALGRAGITMDDLDIIELNEAFAAQVLAVLRTWGLDADDPRLNPHGSGISLGHPVGATGARLAGSLARELHRRDGRYGLATLCIGGGQGISAVFERVGA